MTFGEQGGVGAPPEECARILDTYAEAGGDVADTAVNYRGGQNEEILGQPLEGQRDRFTLFKTPPPATGMIPTRPATTARTCGSP